MPMTFPANTRLINTPLPYMDEFNEHIGEALKAAPAIPPETMARLYAAALVPYYHFCQERGEQLWPPPDQTRERLTFEWGRLFKPDFGRADIVAVIKCLAERGSSGETLIKYVLGG
ncbi:hypothetical protein KQI84_18225 [bacterium]|nr:hypothetical protein [bacterium]